MNDFEELREERRIEEVQIDKARARSLVQRAERRFNNQKDRELTESNAFEVLENVYEAIREMVEAGMAAEGFKSSDHVAAISYAEERMEIGRSAINQLHRFRKLRNESRYEAQEITQKEADQIIKTAENLLPEIKDRVEDQL